MGTGLAKTTSLASRNETNQIDMYTGSDGQWWNGVQPVAKAADHRSPGDRLFAGELWHLPAAAKQLSDLAGRLIAPCFAVREASGLRTVHEIFTAFELEFYFESCKNQL